MEDAVIYLSYLNGTGYVFNVNDYMKLRTDFRIIGNFVGGCNSRGWSTNSNSLPVELTKFETQLLLENKYVKLIRKPCLTTPPTLEDSLRYKEVVEERISEQEDVLQNGKVKQAEVNIEKIILGKRKKLLKSGVAENEIKVSKEEILEEIRRNYKFERNNALLDIPMEHPFEHDAQILDNLPSFENSFHYRVFKDIWSKGMYVTSGELFGADFIAYPGDPMCYHASHLVIILQNSQIRPLDLIAKCRLSVIVNKICIFAYENELNEISYQNIEWLPNG